MENPEERKNIMYHKTNMGTIPVYHDPYMGKDKLIVIYKSKEVNNPGYIFTPYISMMRKPGEESTGPYLDSPIEKDEVDEILKNRKRKKEDIKAFVCNLTDTDEKRLRSIMRKTIKNSNRTYETYQTPNPLFWRKIKYDI